MTDSLKFSVIIPTYNRQASLRACLQSLALQNYHKSNFEVIIVDDAGDPPIQNSIGVEFQDMNVSVLRMLQNEGPAAARNRGAERAHGRYIAFIDDDCVPDANWLAAMESALVATPSSAAGGRIIDGDKGAFSAASLAVLTAAYNYYNAPDAPPRFFAGANLAIPRKEYRDIGGFHPEFRTSEDREFCARWLRHGYKLTYAPEAVVVHQSPVGLLPFLRRHYNYGKGAYRFRALQAVIKKQRMELEPPAYYWQLMRYPMKMQKGIRGIAIAFWAAVSQIASLLGFLAERRRAKHMH